MGPLMKRQFPSPEFKTNILSLLRFPVKFLSLLKSVRKSHLSFGTLFLVLVLVSKFRVVLARKLRENKRYWPLDLLGMIFLRLPVQSLARFKSTSKTLHSLICNPQFTKSHFELTADREERIVFRPSGTPHILSVDFNKSLFASYVLEIDEFEEFIDSIEIRGSCRGFLLLSLPWTLIIWNPSTSFHKQVQWSPFVSSTANYGFICLCGFGYDSSTDDYLIFLGCYDRVRITQTEYFSLKTNEWKNLENPPPYLRPPVNSKGVGSLSNGAIHWLVYGTRLHVIAAFDVTEKTFSEVPLPQYFNEQNVDLIIALTVMEETLHLCVQGSDESVEIWVMKEYKLQSSWTRTIVVPRANFHPLCYTNTPNRYIVGTDDRFELLKYNNDGDLVEERTFPNVTEPFPGEVTQSAVYTMSLLSLPCDSAQAS